MQVHRRNCHWVGRKHPRRKRKRTITTLLLGPPGIFLPEFVPFEPLSFSFQLLHSKDSIYLSSIASLLYALVFHVLSSPPFRLRNFILDNSPFSLSCDWTAGSVPMTTRPYHPCRQQQANRRAPPLLRTQVPPQHPLSLPRRRQRRRRRHQRSKALENGWVRATWRVCSLICPPFTRNAVLLQSTCQRSLPQLRCVRVRPLHKLTLC